jgi:hypothetical protein
LSRIGISITKETPFRDSNQEFSNVYYYKNDPGAIPSAAGAQAIVDTLIALERQWHSTAVQFTHSRVWSAGGGPSENNMINEATLSTAGLASGNSSLDRERAVLIQYEAGFDSRGHRVYLRKWYHICGNWPSATSVTGTTQMANTAAIVSGDRVIVSNQVDDILTVAGENGPWLLCAKSGRGVTSSSPGCHKYLEHRQLGDQWRG